MSVTCLACVFCMQVHCSANEQQKDSITRFSETKCLLHCCLKVADVFGMLAEKSKDLNLKIINIIVKLKCTLYASFVL